MTPRSFPKMEKPAKRHGDPFAATVRRIMNNKWADDQVSRSEALARAHRDAALVDYAPTIETGRDRILVKAWLPKPMGYLGAYPILAKLERDICEIAGGATRISCEGFWRKGNEAGYNYEVSCMPSKVGKIISMFEEAGRVFEQEWMHITTTREEAHHVKTGG